MARRLERLESALFLAGAGAFLAVFLVNYFGTPTTIHGEMIHMLRFFDQPASSVGGELAKVFNVYGTEGGGFRNRPVEYVVQLIGAKLFFLVNSRLPFPILHDFVTPTVLLLTALVLRFAFGVLIPSAPAPFLWLLGGFFLVTGQVLATPVVYSRPAKALASLAIAFLLYVWGRYRERTRIDGAAWYGLTGALCVLTLTDEQTQFALAFFFGVGVIELVAGRKGMPFVLSAAAAGAFALLSGLWLYPLLLIKFGPSPGDNFSSPSSFLRVDGEIAKLVVDAFMLNVGLDFGGLPDGGRFWSLLGLSALLAAVLLGGRDAVRRIPAWFEPFLVFFLLVMTYCLALRHPPILWPDMVRISYFLPCALLSYVGLIMLVNRFGAFGTRAGRICTLVALLVFGAGNVMTTPQTKRVARAGILAPEEIANAQARPILASPGNSGGETPEIEALTPDMRLFVRYFLSRTRDR
jgi:hypothetical protein